ncbi:MAG: hypothetical protein M1368_12460 [Thaumarchaeota archaeon]|nr:hypothetical protein [Nitrososphaerota archaeon]
MRDTSFNWLFCETPELELITSLNTTILSNSIVKMWVFEHNGQLVTRYLISFKGQDLIRASIVAHNILSLFGPRRVDLSQGFNIAHIEEVMGQKPVLDRFDRGAMFQIP